MTVAAVPEDALPNTFLAHLLVTDPDSGHNGRVNCSLVAAIGPMGGPTAGGGSTTTAFGLVRKYANEYQVRRTALLLRYGKEHFSNRNSV